MPGRKTSTASGGLASPRVAAAGGRFEFGQRRSGPFGEVGGAVVAQPAVQGSGQRAAVGGGAVVAEIAEMVDVFAAHEDRLGASLTGQPAVHRGGVHHQIVVGAVEEHPVGEHGAEALDHPAAFDVAGDDAHDEARPAGRRGEQHAHRGVRQHGFDAGQQMGLKATVGDFEHHPGQEGEALVGRSLGGEGCAGAGGDARRGAGRPAAEAADEGEQAGQEEIEVIAEQRCAPRRAGDAHITFDAERFLPQLLDELGELGLFLAGEIFQLGLGDGIELVLEALPRAGAVVAHQQRQPGVLVGAGVEAEQIADEAAAGVGDEGNPCALGQQPDEGEGVVDGAFGEGGVLETEEPAFELVDEFFPTVTAGQLAEGAEGVGAGAVDEDQARFVGEFSEGGVAFVEAGTSVEGAAAPGVEAGLAGQLLFDGPDDGFGAEGGGAGDGHVLDGLAGEFGELFAGQIGDLVRNQGERRDLPPDPFADAPVVGVPRAQGGEVEGGVGATQFGAGLGEAGKALGEGVGAHEDRRAVGGFERQQAGVGGEVDLIRRVFAAACRAESPGAGGDHVGDEGRVLTVGAAAAGAGQSSRQSHRLAV